MSTCRSKSRFGPCGLAADHASDMHAVPIGDGLWFGYHVSPGKSVSVGYGRFEPDGSFRTLDDAPTTAPFTD